MTCVRLVFCVFLHGKHAHHPFVGVFGSCMREVVLLASTPISLCGARHYIPTVLFDCIEELYRTGKDSYLIAKYRIAHPFYHKGIYCPGLFRELPNRRRHAELYKAYNSSPSFGLGLNLRSENTATVAAMLSSFLKNLPEPLLGEPLFEPIWNWCVRPSVQREEARQAHDESEEEEARETYYRTGVRPRRSGRREVAARRRVEQDEDERLAAEQVPVVQCLLRLLPTARLSTLVYTCTFFSQLPLCPENGITLDDLSRMFSGPLIGGGRPASRHVLIWFLKRWPLILDGLLDPGLGPDIPDPPSYRARDVGSDDESEEDEDEDEGDPSTSHHHHYRYAQISHRTRRTSTSSAPSSTSVPDVHRRSIERLRTSDKSGDDVTRSGTPPVRREHGSPLAGRVVPALPPFVFLTEPLSAAIPTEDESPTTLRAQLVCARRERDEALRIVHTLRSVLDG